MKKTFLLIFAFISLMGLMSFSVDQDQSIKGQFNEITFMFATVERPPQFLSMPPTMITVHKGSTLTIGADFISEPQANALLTKVTKDGRVHLERDYSLWVRENSLLITIPNIQETDEGDYNLEIFNTRGNAFATFKIIVLP